MQPSTSTRTKTARKSYRIIEIIDHDCRHQDGNGTLYWFLVRWDGYDDSYNTWEPVFGLPIRPIINYFRKTVQMYEEKISAMQGKINK